MHPYLDSDAHANDNNDLLEMAKRQAIQEGEHVLEFGVCSSWGFRAAEC